MHVVFDAADYITLLDCVASCIQGEPAFGMHVARVPEERDGQIRLE